MNLSPITRLFVVATSFFPSIILALTRDQVPNLRNSRLAAAPGDSAAEVAAIAAASTIQNATFEQLIDHDNPSLGTFSQFYYYSTEFYQGPGSPVVLFTPGEIAVVGYKSYATTNRTSGVIASEIGAALIVIEHRYWGFSSPYQNLTTENLQYQTLKNAIADLNYFALTAKLPFDESGATNADKAPWVLIGGSYSGALTAWTQATTKPSVMWAYYASSAVVETIGNYWSYFLTETLNMPQNCSSDIAAVIEYLDEVYVVGDHEEIRKTKEMFGLGDVTHYDDFTDALANGPYLWQGNQFYENTGFFDFCDAIEGITSNTSVIPNATGVGLAKALPNYANWMSTVLVPGFCESYGYSVFNGTNNVLCFDTYNASLPTYSDYSVDNTYDRQWDWFLCEGFGWWQNGAPAGMKTIVSRTVQDRYWERQCPMWFPKEGNYTYGLAAGDTYNTTNQYTGGWFGFTNSTRLIFVSGTNDPWRTSQVTSPLRPGGPQPSTAAQPVLEVPGGYHTSDLVTANGVANAGCAAVQAQAIAQIVAWVGEYAA
ncbi:putative serine peptidase [Mollisia scopiformis]|uniref:Putative serine peptidase n=1 Tax=Mollisia scopiformis TaxID=149040 RepID=A0A132B547_MOLSC|nr:putative serine peptidase [Mollisia scopiformis]KUJ07461.1 putative serine peptidase [Mollisia scopiformis]